MAILKAYLANVASAIKEKKGIDTPINAQNFVSEILSIQGGGSLNVAYSLTPPTDTSKIWLQCAEPSGVEVQNYLGECAVSNVAYYGAISNPVDGHSSFYCGYYNIGYMGNNQIAIVGYNHIRIYDLTSKKYIADYTISVGTSDYYTNVLFKDNVLYFGYDATFYKYDLSTQTLVNLGIGNAVKYIFFYSENEIDILVYYSSNSRGYRYRYDINTNTKTEVFVYYNKTHLSKITTNNSFPIFKIGNYIYCLNYSYSVWKLDLVNNTFIDITSMADFVTNTLGGTLYTGYYAVGDNERYIYLVGGNTNGTNTFRQIARYDTINDTFELLNQKLTGGKYRHFNILIDSRVYIFGGGNDTSTPSKYGRPNQIDYFDLSYPLTQNNAIITTNTINTDNNLPLINTDKLKLNSNIASAYKGNADNLAEKVNAYYYQTQISNDTYSSITFDKNTIVSNFENITNAINNNGGVLGCAFGGDSENANYSLMATIGEEENTIALVVMNGVEYVMIGVIGSDGTLYESYGSTPCTWLDGDTNTTTFDNSYELNTVYDGGLPLSTPQELIDLGVCTFGINQGGEIGYWKGINCEDYVEE